MKCWECDEKIEPNQIRCLIKWHGGKEYVHLSLMSFILTNNEEFDESASDKELDHTAVSVARVFGSVGCALDYITRELIAVAFVTGIKRKGNGSGA